MKYLNQWIAALMCFTIVGCASVGNLFTETPSSQQAIVKLTVQYATLKAVKNDPARAEAVTGIVAQALVFVEGGEDRVISAEQLQDVLTSVLPQDLAPEDQLVASSLIALVVQEISARIPAGQAGIPVAEVSTVLGWVREAAALVPQQELPPVEALPSA